MWQKRVDHYKQKWIDHEKSPNKITLGIYKAALLDLEWQQQRLDRQKAKVDRWEAKLKPQLEAPVENKREPNKLLKIIFNLRGSGQESANNIIPSLKIALG